MTRYMETSRSVRRIDSLRAQFEKTLKTWVEIPTVSMDPERGADIRRGVEAAMMSIREIGGEPKEVRTTGNPVVFGRFWKGRGLPTVTLYNHLDVQPAGETTWRTEPFRFVKRGTRYLGRGTTDDKGPAAAVLFACRLAREAGLRVNLNVVWEFEEEIGSPHFAEAIGKIRRALTSNVVVVSDTIWIRRGVPAIPLGLRGMVTATLRLRTGEKDVHSGLTGGVARNPIAELSEVISKCVDARSGRVLIPGFYDGVLSPTRHELESFRRSGFSVAAFKRSHGLKGIRCVGAASVMQRIWCLPTFEVHGITGGYAGPGVKTIVPQSAEAKISMRLVPNIDPERVFRKLKRHVARLNPDVEVRKGGVLAPFIEDGRGEYFAIAREAVKTAFGRYPAFVREGGSIGAVLTLRRALKVPVILMGLSLPEHGYHAPNENFDWPQARGGLRMFFEFFRRVEALDRP